jgi:hypothetical protein
VRRKQPRKGAGGANKIGGGSGGSNDDSGRMRLGSGQVGERRLGFLVLYEKECRALLNCDPMAQNPCHFRMEI